MVDEAALQVSERVSARESSRESSRELGRVVDGSGSIVCLLLFETMTYLFFAIESVSGLWRNWMNTITCLCGGYLFY
jgi:hypothetical protein